MKGYDMPRTPSFKGALVFEDVREEAPVGRAGGPDLAPFVGFVNSAEQRRLQNHPRPGVGVTIPAGAKSVFDSRCRQAAGPMGIGVKVVFHDHTTPVGRENKLTEGKLRAIVQTMPKKAYKPRKKTAEQKAEEAAAKAAADATAATAAPAPVPAQSVTATARSRKG